MAQVAWRCVNEAGDVKYAARESHVESLEAKGYTCTLDPDAQWDTITIYSHDEEDS
jgi:hypothetical protein